MDSQYYFNEPFKAPIKKEPYINFLYHKISNELAIFLDIDITIENKFIKKDIIEKLFDYITTNKLYFYEESSINYNLILNDKKIKVLFNLVKNEYKTITKNDILKLLDNHLRLTPFNIDDSTFIKNDIKKIIKNIKNLKQSIKDCESFCFNYLPDDFIIKGRTFLNSYIEQYKKTAIENVIEIYNLDKVYGEIDFFNIILKYLNKE